MKNLIIILLLSPLFAFSQIEDIKPYERNTYFFIRLPEPAFNAILKHTIESKESAIKLWDDSYLVKLPMDADIPSVLNAYTPYNHADMLIEKAIREQGRPQL